MGRVSSSWKPQEIRFSDFQLLSSHCASTVLHFLPFGSTVSFLSVNQVEENSEWLTAGSFINKVIEKERPVYSRDGRFLFLPLFSCETNLVAIGALEVIDYSFAKDVSMKWLLDRCRVISRECALLKRLYFDPLTGFLNGTFFWDSLEHLFTDSTLRPTTPEKNDSSSSDSVAVVLVEVYRKGSDYNRVLNYINRTGHFLLSCASDNDVFSYLGKGVFGFIWTGVNEKQSHQKIRNLLSWLKREGFPKTHIGIVCSDLSSDQEKLSAEILLQQAWQSLATARTRGPYAFFFYESEQTAEKHPLRDLSKTVRNKLSGLWRGIDRFAVVLLHCDQKSHEIDLQKIHACLEPDVEMVPVNQQEVYLFIAGVSAEEALQKAGRVKDKLTRPGEITFSMGIASYPHHTFNKSEIPVNARKALLHTFFYGPDTATVFNGLSLNVSGDIYYEEGDMLSAAREYRKGISIDPENINLLNSLGETYAQMNRHRQAKYYFSEVLKLDQLNYMALFNSGVASVMLGEEESAINFFEKGLRIGVNGKAQGESGVEKGDAYPKHLGLFFQLGRLYCRKKMFEDAVPLLEQSVSLVAAEPEWGSSCLVRRTLAEAYKGCGENKKAISILQTVLNLNPYDSDALSMLGELYELEGQGDDIALSLCLKAVEIDENRSEYFYRVARIYYKLNRLEEADEVIRKSLKLKRKNLDALFLAGLISQKLGRKRDALRKYTSVLRLDSDHEEAGRALKGI
jgi:tetratricopeptide (TPR) repeat protein